MLLPNPGSLINSLRASLKEAVLPALEKGNAQRQLKAALHLLGRLEKSWDLYGQHVQQDNKDIEKTLAVLLQQLSKASVAEKFKQFQYQLNHREHVVEKIDGLSDPVLIKASHRNLQLQECLQNFETLLQHTVLETDIQLSCTQELAALYRRMAARDAVYVGDRPLERA